MPLTVIAQFQARPGRAADLEAALLALVGPTRAEEGCEIYELHRSVETEGSFHFHEIWSSRAAWDAHMQTDHLKAFGAVRDDLVADVRLQLFEKIA